MYIYVLHMYKPVNMNFQQLHVYKYLHDQKHWTCVKCSYRCSGVVYTQKGHLQFWMELGSNFRVKNSGFVSVKMLELNHEQQRP